MIVSLRVESSNIVGGASGTETANRFKAIMSDSQELAA